jgi:hypothetical protein
MDTSQTHDAEYVLGHSAQEFERLINQAQLYEPFTSWARRPRPSGLGMNGPSSFRFLVRVRD